jgi:hypothetical protein
VESAVLYEQSANVLAEAELNEEWLAAAINEDDADWHERAVTETEKFDTFIGPLRDDLKEASRRAAVRRTVTRKSEDGSDEARCGRWSGRSPPEAPPADPGVLVAPVGPFVAPVGPFVAPVGPQLLVGCIWDASDCGRAAEEGGNSVNARAVPCRTTGRCVREW